MNKTLFMLIIFCIPRLSVCEKSESFVNEIIPLMESGNYSGVITKLIKFNREHSDRIAGSIYLGKLYQTLGTPNSLDLAEKTFNEVLKQYPGNSLTLQNLEIIEQRRGKNKSLREFIVKSDNIHQGMQEQLDQMVEIYILLRDVRSLKEVSIKLEDWLKSDSSNTKMALVLGKIYIALGKPEQAIQILFKITKSVPDNPIIHKTISEAYLLAGNEALFAEEYLHWLVTETNDSILKNEYNLIELILPDDELIKFRNVPFRQKSTYLYKYLNTQNHDNSTNLNEQFPNFYRWIALFISGKTISSHELTFKNPYVAFFCALVPGAIVRGSGYLYAGHKKTFLPLFTINTVASVGLLFGLFNSFGDIEGGSSNKDEGWAAGGLMLFFGTWAFDIIGAPIVCTRDNRKKKNALSFQPYFKHNEFGNQSGMNLSYHF